MSKSITINKIDLDESEKYTISSYPGKGLYELPSGALMIVLQYPGSTTPSVIQAGNVADYESSETSTLEATSQSSISESLLLKAIAISSNPELAKELV